MTSVHPESRKEFQLERLILFSDAVFAIAITLLIIEIKVPELHGAEATERGVLRALSHLIPKFIGFLISFGLIGMYWTRHHFLFGFVVASAPRLLGLNLAFLLSIVLMPFSTGFFGEYSVPGVIHLKTPLIFYVSNVCLSGFLLFLLWHYVGNPANGVADPSLPRSVVKDAKRRTALVSFVFALTVVVAFFNSYAARYVPLLTPLVIRLGSRLKGRD
jgi:uncharacterized membrane protein